MSSEPAEFETPITLDRDSFMRRLVSSLGHLNEGLLGSDVAGAYILNVGLSMGAAIEAEYKRYWRLDRALTVDEYAHVIVDLEQKIHGRFSLVSKEPEKVIVQTSACPFDAYVRQSPSLCFMTSSLFGGIAARNFGYAKVVLHRRIALGDPNCYVTIHLQRNAEARAGVGREYFPEFDRASPDIAQQLRLMENARRLRRELGNVTSRWEEVVRGAADAIWVLSPDGRVAYANARWREVLGYEGDELVGGEAERLAHPNDLRRARDLRQRSLKGERISGAALRLRSREGAWRDVLVSVGPLHGDDAQVHGSLWIAHDVTDEREVQRLKDHYMSTASHELRTPVTTIKILTDLLLRTLKSRAPLDAAEFARRIELIQREADRLSALGTDLLEASLLQTGRMALKRERYDLNEIVEAAVERFRLMVEHDGRHTLAQYLAPHAIPVSVARTRIEHVIGSLLENAITFSPAGGEVAISTELRDDLARVRVTDQGIGIPAAELPHLFSPFYRATNADSRHLGGIGLGLYLSRGVLDSHGGALSVTSTEGEGATFTLELPAEADKSSKGQGKVVLVVDDDDGFQETLQALLEMEGYDVVVARDGQEALAKLEEITPAVILLDLMMPRMNGFDFAQELTRRGLRPAIPIVVLTADGRAGQKVEQIGAEGHLGKPFDVNALLQVVNQLAQGV